MKGREKSVIVQWVHFILTEITSINTSYTFSETETSQEDLNAARRRQRSNLSPLL